MPRDGSGTCFLLGLGSRAVATAKTANGTAKFRRETDGAKAPVEPSVEPSTAVDVTQAATCTAHLAARLYSCVLYLQICCIVVLDVLQP
jgi:hypothetical protein